MNLVKKRIKIGELFEKYAKNPTINDDIVETKIPIFIKGVTGNLIKLKGVIRKTNCSMTDLKFEKNLKLLCAEKHMMRSNNEFKKVVDININEYVDNLKYEKVKLISKEKVKSNSFAYDISMETEHVYNTPNGLIHHNSMLAMQAMGNAQKINNGKILTSFLDSEEATTTIRLANLGVKYPKIKPYSDMTIEKVFKFLEGLCLFKEGKKLTKDPSIVIWDSIANTLSQKEREVEDINSVIGYKARLLSILIPKYVAKLTPYNICLIAVNQLRDQMNIGPYGPPKELKFMAQGKTIPGGNTIRFNAFHLLEMKTGAVLDSEKYGFDGVVVKAKCVKNKLFPPNIEIELVGDFVRGFSNFWTNWHFLSTHNRVKSAGGWVYLTQSPTVKFRTKEAPTRYKEDEEFKKMFDDAVKETLNTELIDKYNPDL